MARLLILAGAEVNTTGCSKNYTPLHEAARGGYHEIVKLLLEYEAKCDALCDRKLTPLAPLHLTCRKGLFEIAQLLLEGGANVHSVGTSRYTPLHEAARAGHLLLVELLLKHMANVDAECSHGHTP
ncbi:ankyrin repeat protein, partial [Baffinella frigidus]